MPVVIVILLSAVLLVLTTSMSFVSTQGYKTSVNQSQIKSANYLADAAYQAAFQKVLSFRADGDNNITPTISLPNASSISDVVSAIKSIQPFTLNGGTCSVIPVALQNQQPNTYTFQAIGSLNKQQTSTITFSFTFAPPNTSQIIVRDSSVVKKNSQTPDIQYNQDVPSIAKKISSSIEEGIPQSNILSSYDDMASKISNGILNGSYKLEDDLNLNGNLTINGNFICNSLKLDGNSSLTVNGSLITDSNNSDNNITLNGNSVLKVTNGIIVNGNFTMNGISSLDLFYDLLIGGGTSDKACAIDKNATLTLENSPWSLTNIEKN